MKQFGTHLPQLSRTEILLVIGQFQHVLDVHTGGAWQVMLDAKTDPNPYFQAMINYPLAGGNGQIDLMCQLFTTLANEPTLYVSFEDKQGWQVSNEQIVVITMRRLHNVLCQLLSPPPGIQMWSMTSGSWKTRVYFDS